MPKIDVKGACDLHIHTAPDNFERIANDVEMATICRDAGMRAIAYKCHCESTVSRAWHTQKQVEGIKVLGGLVLNNHVGGINPSAVDAALKMGAAEIWMPSYHSKKHLEVMGALGSYGYQKEKKSNYSMSAISIFDEHQNLIPEVYPILEMIKEHNAIIGTSHLSVEEGFALISAARDIGCQRILVTHPFFIVPEYTVAQVKEAVDRGAMIELCASAALSPIPKSIPIAWYVEAIKMVGAEHFVISTDTGQMRKTFPPETLRMFAQTLYYKGVSEKELHQMMCTNFEKLVDF